MTYAEFVNLVERLWDEIPEAFKKGPPGGSRPAEGQAGAGA
jgi:hypothetical protein